MFNRMRFMYYLCIKYVEIIEQTAKISEFNKKKKKDKKGIHFKKNV